MCSQGKRQPPGDAAGGPAEPAAPPAAAGALPDRKSRKVPEPAGTGTARKPGRGTPRKAGTARTPGRGTPRKPGTARRRPEARARDDPEGGTAAKGPRPRQPENPKP
ncbi:MAG: hypothetical protein LBT40_14775 [Deltaproteobacteria bacterium]|nr:hypothetical protein [Deltaproteobacteria bacterium]